ncbi:MAG: hypothetical protein MZV63_56215 [Marinilabiliales bacterium]|nr:hypothetical protein [Marinilabiliales bacterium]
MTNAIGTSTETKTWYLHVGCNGCWTGITSTDWYDESNWHNYLVPAMLTDVTIPTTAPSWPVYAADFSLGTLCRSITMVGDAQMDVTGDFTIEAGARLSFTGSGTFRLTGDWVNYGIYDCGTGTIELLGTGPSIIPGGIFRR